MHLLPPYAVLSHESAARTHGIELVEPGQETVTVPRNRGRVIVPGHRVVRADLAGGDRVVVGEVAVTSVERTLVDLSRRLPPDEGVAAADSALRQGMISTEDLRAALLGCRGRGAAGPRAISLLMDARSESVLESLTRTLLVLGGLRPVLQFVIRDQAGRFIARVDFCWPEQRLVVEADGFAFHADRAAYRHDRDRLNQLERLGWRVLRFTWEDVRHRPEHVLRLVEECLSATAA